MCAGRFHLELKSGEVDELRREIRRNNRNNIHAIVGSALVLTARVVYLLGPTSWLNSGFPLLPPPLGLAGDWLVIKVLSEL